MGVRVAGAPVRHSTVADIEPSADLDHVGVAERRVRRGGRTIRDLPLTLLHPAKLAEMASRAGIRPSWRVDAVGSEPLEELERMRARGQAVDLL